MSKYENLIAFVEGAPEKVKAELEALFNECQQWKNNHSNAVSRAALLRQRPDLPVDRIPAYEKLVELQGDRLDVHVVDLTNYCGMRLFAGPRAAKVIVGPIPSCTKLVFKVGADQTVTSSFFFHAMKGYEFDKASLDTDSSNGATIEEFKRALLRLSGLTDE